MQIQTRYHLVVILHSMLLSFLGFKYASVLIKIRCCYTMNVESVLYKKHNRESTQFKCRITQRSARGVQPIFRTTPTTQMLSQPFQPPDTQAPPPPALLSTRVLCHQSRLLLLPPLLTIPQNRQNQQGRHHLPPNEWLVRDATWSGQQQRRINTV